MSVPEISNLYKCQGVIHCIACQERPRDRFHVDDPLHAPLAIVLDIFNVGQHVYFAYIRSISLEALRRAIDWHEQDDEPLLHVESLTRILG